MTIFLIMLVQALPVYIVARVFKSGTFVTLTAISMAVLAIATGRSAYTAIDLFGIGVAYWIGLMHVTAAQKEERSLVSKYSASVEAAHRPMTFAETETAVHSPARATSVAFRQQMEAPRASLKDSWVDGGSAASKGGGKSKTQRNHHP